MPLLALLLVASVIGGVVEPLSLAVSHRHPGRAAAREIATTVAERPKLRRASRRLDPTSATRLALALARAIVIGGGLLLAALAFLIRSQNGLARVDQSVAAWGQQHASALTDNVPTAITFVGQPVSIHLGGRAPRGYGACGAERNATEASASIGRANR